jgi:YD repeat-containing protein
MADSGSGRFNATTRFSYNAFGLPLTVTDPVGVMTQNTYDSANNLTSTIRDAGTGHLNQTTSYTFNARGDPLTVTNANGNTTG